MEDPAVLAEFIAEAQEHLAAFTVGLLTLEELPEDKIKDSISPLFRAMHSIKGSAGFLGFHSLEQLAHCAETLLDGMRKDLVKKTPEVIDLLMRVADSLQAQVTGLPESQKSESSGQLELLILLREAAKGSSGESKSALKSDAPAATMIAPAVIEQQQATVPPANTLNSTPEIDPALLKEFVAEAREHLAALSDGLLALEEADAGKLRGNVDPLFRATHSIKGSAGFLGFKGLERLAHSAETLLDGIRKGTVAVSQVVTDLLLKVADRMQSAVGHLPVDSPGDHDDLIKKIQNIIISGRPDLPSPAVAGAKTTATKTQPTVEVPARPDTPVQERSATLRVPVEVIDRLMNLASELVLARNQALETLPTPPDTRGRQLMQRISSITTDLQQAVMLTRMQPVGTLFNRFPRMVRDLARTLGKRIYLVVTGSEVELDKSVLEKLADPLNHLVRNACDHGLEVSGIRLANGKTEVGTLELIARQEGGQILVRIEDDGRGIDPEKVKAKALERGLVTLAELEGMSDYQSQSLILKAGFSTAEKVTDISGRGVGLDVVKTNLESIGGTLQIESVPGKGTSFSLRLPLTLAIIPALVVRTGGERVCLPQRDLVELVNAKQNPIIPFGDRHVVELRGQPIEVIHLAQVLGLEPENKKDFKGPGRSGFLAVVHSGKRKVALVVDELAGSQEIVVKPLHPLLRGLGLHGGATVLADGLPALILDLDGVVRAAGPPVLIHDDSKATAAPSRVQVPSQPAVIFAYGPEELFAVPLSLLRRVDRVVSENIEKIGTITVARLESGNLNMVYPDQVLSVSGNANPGNQLFLLTPKGPDLGRALVATSILDTALIPMVLDPSPLVDEGILGSTRIENRLILVINPAILLERISLEVVA